MKELQPLLNPEDKELMEKLLSARRIEHKYALRLQTIPLRAEGKGTGDISDFPGIHQSTAGLYINRYNTFGVEPLLKDKTRKPGKEPISQTCRLVCNEKPKGETRWSCRTLAGRVGIGRTSVNRMLREPGLQPHTAKKRNYSNDPDFESKPKDAVGLYLNPPLNAIILCVDGKSQMQALERSRPTPPIIRNVPERQSVDCLRHGTTALFAALDVLNGKVIGECNPTHKGEDYVRFLKKVDKACGKGKALHITADNPSAHKTKTVYGYLQRVPKRFVLHFIPMHSSWLNMVERRFGETTDKRMRRGGFESVQELTTAVKEYIKTWNKSGRSFTWTKKPDGMPAKINKAKAL
jgi:transposase